ncbi:hypothetical protein ACHAWF_002895 [Thalassiosira exigua]
MCSRLTTTLILNLLVCTTTKRMAILIVSRAKRDTSSRSQIVLCFNRASFGLIQHCQQWKLR